MLKISKDLVSTPRRRLTHIVSKLVLWSGLMSIVLAGVAGVVFLLLTSILDKNDIREFLDREVKAATGRNLTIGGDITIHPSLFPVVEVESVSLGNAGWSNTPVMLRADHMFGRFSLLQLLRGRFVLEEIAIEDVNLLLETDTTGRNNWDFTASALADGSAVLQEPSITSLDQINDVLASLLSITSYVDEFYINDLTVRYNYADTETIRVYDIGWVGMESADQDRRLVLDISAGASRRNQSLHLEIYKGSDFLNKVGRLGLTLAIDAEKWEGQITGYLEPKQDVTAIDLDMALTATDTDTFYHDLNEVALLPQWPDIIEPLTFNLRALVQGTLRHPLLDQVVFRADGKRGSQIRFKGQVNDVLEAANIDGKVSAIIGNPAKYGTFLLNDPVFWSEMESADPGALNLTGDLGGQILNPALHNATITWGDKGAVWATARNLDMDIVPFTLSSDLSFEIRDKRFISMILENVFSIPPTESAKTVGNIVASARVDTTPDGRLDADRIDISIGEASSMQVTVSGTIMDLLGQVDPALSLTLNADNDQFLHRLAQALLPENWNEGFLPIAPLESTATLIRGELGKLELIISKFDVGDPNIIRISGEGEISALQSLDGLKVTLQATAKDSIRSRQILERYLPKNSFLARMPQLDEITLSTALQGSNGELTVSSFVAHTGGALPMTVSSHGSASLGSSSYNIDGAILIEGPDMYALQETVANLLAPGNLDPKQFERPSALSPKDFRVGGNVIVDGDNVRISDFSARFADSHLSAQLQMAAGSARPHVTLSISDASFYLPEISDLLMPEGGETEPAPESEARIFQAWDYEFPVLMGFDMSVSAAGDVIGFDSPILDSFTMDLGLEQGQLHLRRFQGMTTNGNFLLSADWNIAGVGEPEMYLNLEINKISLGSLLHRTEVADWLRDAPTSGTVKGRLRGRSPADLAASFTGQVDLSVGLGEIDKSVLDWLGGDLVGTLYSTINPFSKTIPYSQLLCAEARLPFVDGIAEFEKKIALETKRVALMASGRIDLGKEIIDLSLASTPKEGFGPSIGGALVRLKGPLNNPEFVLDKWGASKKAFSVGTSILTGGVSSLLETIFDRLTKETNLCQSVVGESVLQ